MKTYEEVAKNVLLRAQAEKHRVLQLRKRIFLSCSGAVLIIALTFLGVRASKKLTSIKVQTSETEGSQAVSNNEITMETGETYMAAGESASVPSAATQQNTITASQTISTTPASFADTPTVAATSQYAEDVAGDGGIPENFTLPEHENIRYDGERITRSEAQAYLTENLPWITSALNASGVNSDSPRIMGNGYCHLSIGEDYTVHLNFMDFLLFSGDRLISILTLFKENGEIYCTPSFGAPWFDAYAAFLASHRGEKLLFLYLGQTETVLTPDNQCWTIVSGAERSPFDGALDYQKLYCDEIVYVPQ